MSNSDSFRKFIDLVIEKTINNEMKWSYLDDYPDVAEGLKLVYGNSQSPIETLAALTRDSKFSFDEENSFVYYDTLKNTYLVLYELKSNNKTKFVVVPSTYKNITYFDNPNLADIITKLKNAVYKQFPNSLDYIDDFIKPHLEL